jgi:hypothetical protein
MKSTIKRERKGNAQSRDLSPAVRQQLDKRLLAYTLAGSGVFAFSPCAHAQIVYTPTDITIAEGSTLQIDLNNDGTYDFNIVNTHATFCDTDGGGRSNCTFYGEQDLMQVNAKGDPADAGAWRIGNKAIALSKGRTIGPPGHNPWAPVNSKSLNMACVSRSSSARGTFTHQNATGNFVNVTNKYLGLRFVFDSQVHYGWASFVVSSVTGFTNFGITATLDGYAYQASPNTAILAGDTGMAADAQPDAERTPSVRLLSTGQKGVKQWREQKRQPGMYGGFTPCG